MVMALTVCRLHKCFWNIGLTECIGPSPSGAISSTNPLKPAAASGLVHGAPEGHGEDADEDGDKETGADLNGNGQTSNGKSMLSLSTHC
jgi:hypothetical protein